MGDPWGAGTVSPARATTALFVPGDRPDRARKALDGDADVVIVDLEDAVADEAKASAREVLPAVLAAGRVTGVVRINGIASHEHAADLAVVERLGPAEGLRGVLVPKAESCDELDAIGARLRPGVELIALIESAAGVQAVASIARARGLSRLALGGIDLALDLGSTAPGVLDHARAALAIASRAAELAPPLDSPSLEIDDLAAVRAAAEHARGFGFGGMLCIHPRQLDAVRAAFRPAPVEIAWAERIVATAGQGAVRIDGRMVDRPVLERARRILVAQGATTTEGRE